MTDKIKARKALLKSGEYKKGRRALPERTMVFPEGTDALTINALMLEAMLAAEEPVFFGEDDRIGFNRTIEAPPIGVCGDVIYDGGCGNVTPDYAYVLAVGMDTLAERIQKKLLLTEEEEKRILYNAMLSGIRAALSLADRYRAQAEREGHLALADALSRVPHGGAVTFLDGCVFLKFIQFTLRANRNSHMTFGGFDKYMLPYFEADLARGVSEDALFEILEEFFISLNFDSDTYFGIQQGDNGMSMVLGGRDMAGRDRYNKLSELCLKASTELCLIDPKINLRVDKETPLSRLVLATELTKKGLGFPQYCNDDVVIPGLLKLGYAPKDAYDYTVAACWEFIVPGCAFDIANAGKVNFPRALARAVDKHLTSSLDFDSFFARVKEEIAAECHEEARLIKDHEDRVSPYLSVFISDCIERGLDATRGGAVYRNHGAHGVGIASAADAICAIRRAVFVEKICTAEELKAALDANFEGYAALQNTLRAYPKMGNNEDEVDAFADVILTIFADTFAQYKTSYGGGLRPGTGSAMEYLWSAAQVGATADGREAHTPFGSSFSPAPTTRLSGPLSCIQSFTKHDMTEVINGGPLTMEIHENTFRSADGVEKVAKLVQAFIALGGHELQLNSINREVLLDAQKHPENHKNLIVRVWGWSGYFNELDPEFQNHIISRTEFTV